MNQQVPDELISAYFDGEVTPAEREQVEQLLASSVELRQVLDDTSKLSALLHSFPREAVPAQLANNVQDQIASVVFSSPSPAGGRGMRREWMAFGAGMMATMASLLLWVSFNPSSGPTTAATVAQTKSHITPDRAVLAARDQSKGGISNSAVPLLAQAEPHAADAVVNDSLSASPALVSAAKEPSPQSYAPAMEADAGLVDEYKLPQPTEELLRSLKNGDVVEQRILDPNNAVTVVELTVVDINKGVEGLQLLLQKRNLRHVENVDATEKPAGNPSTVALRSEEMKKAETANSLVALYVRASGAELADMLSELVKDQPDLYRGLSPQLPMELPSSVIVKVERNSAPTAPAAAAATVQSQGSPAEQQSIAVEANLVVQSFAVSNGMSVDNPLSVQGQQLKHHQYKSARFGAGPVGRIGGAVEQSTVESKPIETNAPAVPLVQTNIDKSRPMFDKARQANHNNSLGYTEFHLAMNQSQPSEQQSLPRQNSTQSFQYAPRGNEGVAPGGSGVEQGSSQSNSENRDPRLMRMLIVVKPERVAPNP